MSIEDARNTVLAESEYLLEREDTTSLLLELPRFLERLAAEPALAEALEEMSRDVIREIDALQRDDDEAAQKLERHRGAIAQDQGALDTFDAIASRPSELSPVLPIQDADDRTTAAALLRHLREHRALLPEAVREDVDGDWRERKAAHRCSTMRIRTVAGFALERLRFATRQLDPRSPEGQVEEWAKEQQWNVIGDPELLRDLVDRGLQRQIDIPYVQEIDANVRHEVRVVRDDLLRRLRGTRSREGVLLSYKLRCEWYDAAGMAALIAQIEEERAKEDRLSEHLARYLFDHGLRPLVRPMVGRLEPDMLQDMGFAPGFYVEVKQYEDEGGARRALREGAPQIWSTLSRTREAFDLREAFLVVFRRGGPLLRFQGPACSSGVVLRPILIDVASGSVSGSRQHKEKTIDVTPQQLLHVDEEPGPVD